MLPPIRDIYSAAEQFNRCFAALLVGGVYCEAVNPDGLEFASILGLDIPAHHRGSEAGPNVFHRHARMQMAPPIEAIRLVGPRVIEMTAIEAALRTGRSVLERVPEISPEFLLKSVTGAARRDWAAALSNPWVVVEQVTSHLGNSGCSAPRELTARSWVGPTSYRTRDRGPSQPAMNCCTKSACCRRRSYQNWPSPAEPATLSRTGGNIPVRLIPGRPMRPCCRCCRPPAGSLPFRSRLSTSPTTPCLTRSSRGSPSRSNRPTNWPFRNCQARRNWSD